MAVDQPLHLPRVIVLRLHVTAVDAVIPLLGGI